jgi:hypothetical protein
MVTRPKTNAPDLDFEEIEMLTNFSDYPRLVWAQGVSMCGHGRKCFGNLRIAPQEAADTAAMKGCSPMTDGESASSTMKKYMGVNTTNMLTPHLQPGMDSPARSH